MHKPTLRARPLAPLNAPPTARPSLTPNASPLLVHLWFPRASAVSVGSVTSENSTAIERPPSGSDNRDDGTSDSSASTSPSQKKRSADGIATEKRLKKPRKPTHTVRKEAKQALLEEIAALEARAETLRASVGLPSLVDDRSLETAQQVSLLLEETHRDQLLALCQGQAMLSQYLRDRFAGPLRVPIALGRDPAQRRASLLAIRRQKLAVAYKYLEHRLAGVDDRTPFTDNQSWVAANGDHCFHRSDISQFEGVRSLKDVFDALMFYMSNMEITISEELGQLTLREDFDCVDTTISNSRIVSSTDHGLVVEVNAASFAEYSEKFADRDGAPFALMTNDSVDSDELYPFCPNERVQRTITAAVSLSCFRKPPSDETEEGGLVVVMRRCAYLSIKKPQFEISRDAFEDLRHSIAAWGDVMTKTIRERARAAAVRGPLA